MSSVGGRSKRLPGIRVKRLESEAADGAHDVWYGTAHVVVKRDGGDASMVVNEFVCTRLAIGLGLPVPMGDAAELDGRNAWVSAEIALDGVTLPAADPDEVLKHAISDLAGICVFDVWVANHDRSDENILFHPRVGLWAIDHEAALAGPATLHPTHLAREVMSKTHWSLVDPARLSERSLQDWAERIRTISPHMIDSTLREAQARRLLDEPQRKAIHHFLSERARMIYHLLAKSIGEEQVPWLIDPPHGI